MGRGALLVLLGAQLVFAIVKLIDCAVYEGPCPAKRDFKIHQNFTCSKVFDNDSDFKV